MIKKDAANSQQQLTPQSQQARSVDIPQALPMRLQTLDLARHTVIDPSGQRYVVATFDDARLGRGYVTAVYPQQNGYLTLVRLILVEYSSAALDEAIQRHVAVAQSIQQGKLKELNRRVESFYERANTPPKNDTDKRMI